MPELEKPNYIKRNSHGGVVMIYCKCCGYIIGMQKRTGFWRSRMYAEVKIRFADRTAHVTNICKKCIGTLQRDSDLLMKVYHSDIDDLCIDNPRMEMFREGKSKPRIVAIDTNGRGIR